MKQAHSTPRNVPLTALRLFAGSVLISGLVACGGGSNSTDTAAKSYTGTVTAYDSPQSFSVDGIPVDASGSSAVPQNLTAGSQVEIHGEMVNGTLKARKVQLDDHDNRDDDNGNPNELEGRVTAYSSVTSFSVDGIPVDASATPIALQVGMHVEIYGTMTNGVLVATSIKLEDRNASSSSGSTSRDDSADDSAEDDDNCTVAGKSDCEDHSEDDSEDNSGKDKDSDRR